MILFGFLKRKPIVKLSRKLILNDLSNVDPTSKVKVFRNLTKKCYSVVQRGYTVAHVSSIDLEDCEFKVSEKIRQSVIRDKRKKVHAFVVGRVSYNLDQSLEYKSITYNPYKYSSFVLTDTELPVYLCKYVRINTRVMGSV